MEGGRIRLQSDDGNWELEILEETVVSGINYVFAEGDEAERIMDVFAKLLEGEDISIER